MYNGIGQTTPRGNATNGYVQPSNFALDRHRKAKVNCNPEETFWKLEASVLRKPNLEILDHESKRKIELKCVEMEELMSDQGYTKCEIQSKVLAFRQALTNQTDIEIPIKNDLARPQACETDQLAEANHKKSAHIRKAFDINDQSHVDDSSLDADRKTKKTAATSASQKTDIMLKELSSPSPELSSKKIATKRRNKRRSQSVESSSSRKEKAKKRKHLEDAHSFKKKNKKRRKSKKRCKNKSYKISGETSISRKEHNESVIGSCDAKLNHKHSPASYSGNTSTVVPGVANLAPKKKSPEDHKWDSSNSDSCSPPIRRCQSSSLYLHRTPSPHHNVPPPALNHTMTHLPTDDHTVQATSHRKPKFLSSLLKRSPLSISKGTHDVRFAESTKQILPLMSVQSSKLHSKEADGKIVDVIASDKMETSIAASQMLPTRTIQPPLRANETRDKTIVNNMPRRRRRRQSRSNSSRNSYSSHGYSSSSSSSSSSGSSTSSVSPTSSSDVTSLKKKIRSSFSPGLVATSRPTYQDRTTSRSPSITTIPLPPVQPMKAGSSRLRLPVYSKWENSSSSRGHLSRIHPHKTLSPSRTSRSPRKKSTRRCTLSRSMSRSHSSSNSSDLRSRSSRSRSYSSKPQQSSCGGIRRSRSPSIPRRYGSPSFLDKRRITSARKRPIPYHRPSPPSSLSSWSDSWSRSPRSRGRSSSSSSSSSPSSSSSSSSSSSGKRSFPSSDDSQRNSSHSRSSSSSSDRSDSSAKSYSRSSSRMRQRSYAHSPSRSAGWWSRSHSRSHSHDSL